MWNTLTEVDRRGFDDYQIDALVDVLNKRVRPKLTNRLHLIMDQTN